MPAAFELVRGGDRLVIAENRIVISGATGIVTVKALPGCVSLSTTELVFELTPWASRMEGCTLV